MITTNKTKFIDSNTDNIQITYSEEAIAIDESVGYLESGAGIVEVMIEEVDFTDEFRTDFMSEDEFLTHLHTRLGELAEEYDFDQETLNGIQYIVGGE